MTLLKVVEVDGLLLRADCIGVVREGGAASCCINVATNRETLLVGCRAGELVAKLGAKQYAHFNGHNTLRPIWIRSELVALILPSSTPVEEAQKTTVPNMTFNGTQILLRSMMEPWNLWEVVGDLQQTAHTLGWKKPN